MNIMNTTLIDIFDKTYEFCDQIQTRAYERDSYEALCSEVFPGLTFKNWFEAGFWDGNLFNPHVLKDGDNIVSAISVNKMNIQIGNEKPHLFIQLGGVMTADSYRNQGLSSTLMDKILTEWEDKCDGFYLFASENVINYYPKFGFKIAEEFQYYMNISPDLYNIEKKAIRLDMKKKTDIDLLLEHYKLGNPFSLLKINNKGLLMFYCLKYNKNDIYYVESEDAIIIAAQEKNEITVYDIFCNANSSLENILSSIINEDAEKIYFGFPLIKNKHCKIEKYNEEDNYLFVLNNSGTNNLAEFLHISELSNKIMFPLLTHA